MKYIRTIELEPESAHDRRGNSPLEKQLLMSGANLENISTPDSVTSCFGNFETTFYDHRLC